MLTEILEKVDGKRGVLFVAEVVRVIGNMNAAGPAAACSRTDSQISASR
jgi:hypothetical protein